MSLTLSIGAPLKNPAATTSTASSSASLLLRLRPPPPPRVRPIRAMAKETVVEEKIGVRVERNPPESRLSDLGVRSWPKYVS